MCPRTDCTKKPMPSELRVFSGRPRWCAMTATQHVIKWSTACAVVGVAAIAAVASYEHAYALVRVHGEAGWTGRLVPLTVDGLIYASSMVMLDSARRKTPVPALARWLLGLGIAATLAANVAHGPKACEMGLSARRWPRGRRSRSSASGKTVRSSDGVTRLAASPSRGLRPSAGWPIPFLTGHRANRPRRGGAVLMLHPMRVTRESLERRGGSRHD
jgi:hypothetical protein